MAFNVNVANSVTADTLEGYLSAKNTDDILQHVANKPLLAKLDATKKEFTAGGAASGTPAPPTLREPVMGALMKDKASSYAGIAGADTLIFNSSDGEVQTQCPVRWMHAGFSITHEELMYQGVIITN